MKKLTLEEIGKLADVSRATVSRVINNYPHIKPEVRERVQRVIDETGYQPNLIARSLASQRSNILGLIVPSDVQTVFTDPYYPRLIQGIAQACNDNRLTFSLFLFFSKEEEDRVIDNILFNGLCDGLVVTSDYKDDTNISRLIASKMPFVMVGRPENAERINIVDTDNVSGGYRATEHLIKLGHQRIATIASKRNLAGEDRLEGYFKALDDYDLAVDEKLIAYGDYSQESGYQAMTELISEKPTATFIASDTMSLGALRAIQEAGLTVPHDIAIVSYDDLPPATQAIPALTTVRQPIIQTGTIAVEKLLTILDDGGNQVHHVILPNEFIIRDSCGAISDNSRT